MCDQSSLHRLTWKSARFDGAFEIMCLQVEEIMKVKMGVDCTFKVLVKKGKRTQICQCDLSFSPLLSFLSLSLFSLSLSFLSLSLCTGLCGEREKHGYFFLCFLLHIYKLISAYIHVKNLPDLIARHVT